MTEPVHLLVVDDDDRLRALLEKFLTGKGFAVHVAASAEEARKLLAMLAFDLVILDVMMPGESGLVLASSLKESSSAPILFLSALGEVENRIAGLESGGEDYLPKPFEPRELVLRIQAILRRTRVAVAALPPRTELHFGAFRFDLSTRILWNGALPVYLTGSELALLALLAERSGKPVSREELARVGGEGGNERSVDVQITRLRRKIEPSPGKPVHLQTVRNAGYVLHGE